MITEKELEAIKNEWKGVVNVALPKQPGEITRNAFAKAFGISRDAGEKELERLVAEGKATKRQSSDSRVFFYRLKAAK